MKNHNCHICGSEWCRGKCWDKSIETVRVDCLFDGRLTYYRSPDPMRELVDQWCAKYDKPDTLTFFPPVLIWIVISVIIGIGIGMLL